MVAPPSDSSCDSPGKCGSRSLIPLIMKSPFPGFHSILTGIGYISREAWGSSGCWIKRKFFLRNVRTREVAAQPWPLPWSQGEGE